MRPPHNTRGDVLDKGDNVRPLVLNYMKTATFTLGKCSATQSTPWQYWDASRPSAGSASILSLAQSAINIAFCLLKEARVPRVSTGGCARQGRGNITSPNIMRLHTAFATAVGVILHEPCSLSNHTTHAPPGRCCSSLCVNIAIGLALLRASGRVPFVLLAERWYQDRSPSSPSSSSSRSFYFILFYFIHFIFPVYQP